MNTHPKEEIKYRAYKYSIRMVQFISSLPSEKVYWVITDQLLRAATSIGANIIEAQAASSKKDFINYYAIALKSANETKYWLGILRDGTNVDKDPVNTLLEETKELANILGASLLTLKGKRRL